MLYEPGPELLPLHANNACRLLLLLQQTWVSSRGEGCRAGRQGIHGCCVFLWLLCTNTSFLRLAMPMHNLSCFVKQLVLDCTSESWGLCCRYDFQNVSLLKQAFMAPGATYDKVSNRPLAWIGDAALTMLATEGVASHLARPVLPVSISSSWAVLGLWDIAFSC